MLPCDICGKSRHSWFDCPERSKKPEGWKPERLRKPVGENPFLVGSPYRAQLEALTTSKAVVMPQAIDLTPGQVPEPVAFISATKGEAFVETKRGKGRPKSIADMNAYKAEKQRQYRKAKSARLKAEREGK